MRAPWRLLSVTTRWRHCVIVGSGSLARAVRARDAVVELLPRQRCDTRGQIRAGQGDDTQRAPPRL